MSIRPWTDLDPPVNLQQAPPAELVRRPDPQRHPWGIGVIVRLRFADGRVTEHEGLADRWTDTVVYVKVRTAWCWLPVEDVRREVITLD